MNKFIKIKVPAFSYNPFMPAAFYFGSPLMLGLTLPMLWLLSPGTRMQIFLKTIETLSCWYSLENSRRVLSDDYPFARVSSIFQDFYIILYWQN